MGGQVAGGSSMLSPAQPNLNSSANKEKSAESCERAAKQKVLTLPPHPRGEGESPPASLNCRTEKVGERFKAIKVKADINGWFNSATI